MQNVVDMVGLVALLRGALDHHVFRVLVALILDDVPVLQLVRGFRLLPGQGQRSGVLVDRCAGVDGEGGVLCHACAVASLSAAWSM